MEKQDQTDNYVQCSEDRERQTLKALNEQLSRVPVVQGRPERFLEEEMFMPVLKDAQEFAKQISKERYSRKREQSVQSHYLLGKWNQFALGTKYM